MTTFHKRANRQFGYPVSVPQIKPGGIRRIVRPTLAQAFPVINSEIVIMKQPTHAPYFEKPPAAAVSIAANDPEAINKLSVKLTGLENKLADMRRANEYVRAGDVSSLKLLGYSVEGIADLFERPGDEEGYSRAEFTRLHSTIKKTKARIEELTAIAGRVTVTEQTNAYTYQECMTSYRVTFSFNDKPQQWVRDLLGRHGFRWSSITKTWNRMLSLNAISSASFLRKELDKKSTEIF